MIGDGGARWRELGNFSHHIDQLVRWQRAEPRKTRCAVCCEEIEFEATYCAACGEDELRRWAERQRYRIGSSKVP